MDWGILEADFWEMTLAELIRLIESKKRTQERLLKEHATFDYLHADLVGRSLARIYSSSNKYPSIAEAYPSLFSQEQVEETVQQKKDEASAIRFRQFTQSFNQRFQQGGENSKQ